MSRTFYKPAGYRALVLGVTALLAVYTLARPVWAHTDNASTIWGSIFTGLFVALFLCLSLDALLTRIVATDERVIVKDWLNRTRFDATYQDLTDYLFDGSSWKLVAGARSASLSLQYLERFHMLLVERASRALHAKLWRCTQVPPNRTFRHRLYNVSTWASPASGALMSGIVIYAIFRQPIALANGLLMAAFCRAQLLRDLCGRLILTDEVIKVERLGSSAQIAWPDVVAVFCERIFSERVFTVIGGGEAIMVAGHIASDLESMRKLFYSIPNGTLCVNFDASFHTGYRAKGKRKRGEVGEELVTAF